VTVTVTVTVAVYIILLPLPISSDFCSILSHLYVFHISIADVVRRKQNNLSSKCAKNLTQRWKVIAWKDNNKKKGNKVKQQQNTRLLTGTAAVAVAAAAKKYSW